MTGIAITICLISSLESGSATLMLQWMCRPYVNSVYFWLIPGISRQNVLHGYLSISCGGFYEVQYSDHETSITSRWKYLHFLGSSISYLRRNRFFCYLLRKFSRSCSPQWYRNRQFPGVWSYHLGKLITYLIASTQKLESGSHRILLIQSSMRNLEGLGRKTKDPLFYPSPKNLFLFIYFISLLACIRKSFFALIFPSL